jgi:signal transduction histidine kinase
VLIGSAANRAWGPHHDGGGPPGPFPLVGAIFVAAVAGLIATTLAYRRLALPAGELLEAAGRVGAGHYDTRLVPRGPRDLRALMGTFNEMSERLESAEQRRRRFLADVTHELRTPLAVLQSGIEAQLDGIHARDDAHLASLLDETRLLARVVDDLHTLALADAGRLVLHREPVDPGALVEDAVAAQSPAATHRGVSLRIEAAPGLSPLDADPTRLRQVLGNLLGNALRHTPTGGRIVVRVDAPAPGWVRFTVADTGPGFRPDELPGLFDRTRPSTALGGSGLGLAIAHDLVAAHGGDMAAANQTGGGASVSFRVPAAP